MKTKDKNKITDQEKEVIKIKCSQITNTILKVYATNESVDRNNLFYELQKYLVNKQDIIKCLHFIVDGNIFDFDADKIVQRMSSCDEFSDDELLGWTREIQQQYPKEVELTEKIIKVLKSKEAYGMIKKPHFKKKDQEDYFDQLLNDATILSIEAET